uniref:Uncharacterized protein n=1 Tax=Syphacia muris TaxID=451379 RepID=A0A0N5AV43_9BILA
MYGKAVVIKDALHHLMPLQQSEESMKEEKQQLTCELNGIVKNEGEQLQLGRCINCKCQQKYLIKQ